MAPTAGCDMADRCGRPVPDMPTCRQRAPSVSRRRLPPLRLRSPFKSAPAHRLWFSVFTILTPNYNEINLR